MFENEIEICKAFNMNPFEVRKQRFSEFLLLIKRMKTYKPKDEKEKNKVTVKVIDRKGVK
jgi:hypothetical protein